MKLFVRISGFHRIVIASLMLTIVVVSGCERTLRQSVAEPGEPFPEIVMTGINRPDLPLASLRGKTVLVNVWAPWCGPCIAEMPQLDRLSRALNPDRFAILGLTVDDRFLAEEFIDDHGIEFANYFDAARALVEGKLGVRYFPQTFIINPNGEIIERITGYREWDRDELMQIVNRQITINNRRLPSQAVRGMPHE